MSNSMTRISLTRASVHTMCLYAFMQAKELRNSDNVVGTDWINDTMPSIDNTLDAHERADHKQVDMENSAQWIMEQALALPEDTEGKRALLQAISIHRKAILS